MKSLLKMALLLIKNHPFLTFYMCQSKSCCFCIYINHWLYINCTLISFSLLVHVVNLITLQKSCYDCMINFDKINFIQICYLVAYPVSIYWFKINNKNTRIMCEICSKLSIKIQEQHQWHGTDFTHCSGVSIINFEQVNVGWVVTMFTIMYVLFRVFLFLLNMAVTSKQHQ